MPDPGILVSAVLFGATVLVVTAIVRRPARRKDLGWLTLLAGIGALAATILAGFVAVMVFAPMDRIGITLLVAMAAGVGAGIAFFVGGVAWASAAVLLNVRFRWATIVCVGGALVTVAVGTLVLGAYFAAAVATPLPGQSGPS
jgi:hypothetical protein